MSSETIQPLCNIKCLLLLGGHSSRMGKDKGLLVYENQVLYKRAVMLLKTAGYPVYLSLRKEQLPYYDTSLGVPLVDELLNIGPAAALLAAYQHDSAAQWLCLACDYPCAEAESVTQLVEVHNSMKSAVTAFCNDSMPEPVFAIWSPTALSLLAQNVLRGMTGPLYTIRQIQHDHELRLQMVEPLKSKWLINTNTPAEFEAVLRRFST